MVSDSPKAQEFAASAQAAFAFLAPPAGPTVVRSKYSPEHFGNAIVELHPPGLRVRVTRDRSQIFVDLGPVQGGSWFDVESVLRLVDEGDEAQALIDARWQSVQSAAAAISRHLEKIIDAFSPRNYTLSAKNLDELRNQRAKRLFDRA